jgi:diamine N-acetyltransferase
MTIVIERAGRGDVDRLAALGKRTYVDHYSEIWSKDGITAYLESHFKASQVMSDLSSNLVSYFIMSDQGVAIGFAKLNFAKPVPIDPHRQGVELEKIYFQKGATGKGYGSLLIDHIVQAAKDQGEDLMWLDVLKSNHAGKALYERKGFEPVGELPFASDIQDIGMWVMARELKS